MTRLFQPIQVPRWFPSSPSVFAMVSAPRTARVNSVYPSWGEVAPWRSAGLLGVRDRRRRSPIDPRRVGGVGSAPYSRRLGSESPPFGVGAPRQATRAD